MYIYKHVYIFMYLYVYQVYKQSSHLFLLVVFWEKTHFYPSSKTDLLLLVGRRFLQEIAQEKTVSENYSFMCNTENQFVLMNQDA